MNIISWRMSFHSHFPLNLNSQSLSHYVVCLVLGKKNYALLELARGEISCFLKKKINKIKVILNLRHLGKSFKKNLKKVFH